MAVKVLSIVKEEFTKHAASLAEAAPAFLSRSEHMRRKMAALYADILVRVKKECKEKSDGTESS